MLYDWFNKLSLEAIQHHFDSHCNISSVVYLIDNGLDGRDPPVACLPSEFLNSS